LIDVDPMSTPTRFLPSDAITAALFLLAEDTNSIREAETESLEDFPFRIDPAPEALFNAIDRQNRDVSASR